MRMSTAKDASPRWLKNVANSATRRWGTATATRRGTPDYLIIGTKRGGTTSLHNYLLMHPAVLGLFPQPRGVKSTDYFFAQYHRGARWYRSHFHPQWYRRVIERRCGVPPITGEASPFYIWDPRVAERVRSAAPGCRAIVLLRDPVERAWSHYQERVGNLVEPLSFREALEVEEARTTGELDRMRSDPGYYSTAYDWYSYRARGVYVPQLENWLRHFEREQLLIVRSEDMYADVQATFDEVSRFLGIPDFALPTDRRFNASGASAMPADCREELARFFEPHNRELEQFLGREMLWQS